jgi:hypothetical protein
MAGMFKEDYIKRMVAQATTVITYILGLTEQERYPEAHAEVERALQFHLGLNLGLVTALPAAELVGLCRQGEMLDIGKLVVLADLVKAEGDVYRAEGQAATAADRHATALELFLEVAASGEHNRAAVADRLAALADVLPRAAVAPDILEWWDFIASGAPLAAPETEPEDVDPVG